MLSFNPLITIFEDVGANVNPPRTVLSPEVRKSSSRDRTSLKLDNLDAGVNVVCNVIAVTDWSTEDSKEKPNTGCATELADTGESAMPLAARLRELMVKSE